MALEVNRQNGGKFYGCPNYFAIMKCKGKCDYEVGRRSCAWATLRAVLVVPQRGLGQGGSTSPA
eukprot:3368017-Pyramimonas_sp.AAC.1